MNIGEVRGGTVIIVLRTARGTQPMYKNLYNNYFDYIKLILIFI